MLFALPDAFLDAAQSPQVTGGWPHSDRRRFLVAGGAATLGLLLTKPATANENAKVLSGFRAGNLQQVRSIVEVGGDLKFNDGKVVKKLPMSVKAELQFAERFLPLEGGVIRSVRQYSQAQAKMTINGKDVPQELRADRRLIATVQQGESFKLFSPLGPLTSDELELLNSVGRTAGVMGLLTSQPVAPGDTWPITEAAIVQLLALDSVTQHEVTASYIEDKENIALVRFEGKVTGAVGETASEMELKGSLNIDLVKRRPSWLAMSLKENRAIGHAQPGYDAVIKVRILYESAAALPELSDAVVSDLKLAGSESDLLIDLTSTKGGYALLLDRRWCAMVDRHELAVMRFVDRGDLVAQCNLAPLASLPKGEQLTLEGLQGDVKQSLGKSFRQLLDASQAVNENGLAVLRVSAAGQTDELQMQWVYYHLADNEGRRASLVFTFQSDLAERFGTADRSLVASFRFVKQVPATASKPAAKSVVAPKR